jgi:hypothetical protein
MAMALDNTSVNVGRSTNGFEFGAVAQMVGFGLAIVIANCVVFAGSVFTVSRYTRLSKSGRRQSSAS